MEVNEEDIQRARIEPVHLSWKIIGLCARRVFELVDQSPNSTPVRIADLVHDSGQSRTQVYETITRLVEHGLLERGRGSVQRTTRSLDEVAQEHQVDALVAARITRYRAERAAWHHLLALWAGEVTTDCPEAERLPDDPTSTDDIAAWFAAVIAAGPPPSHLHDRTVGPADHDDLDERTTAITAAVDLLAAALGATPLAQLSISSR
jgi:hypothetical protein